MDEKTDDASSSAQEGVEYLHLTEETLRIPSYHSKVLICELWRICLLNLYGGSKAQRLWCKKACEKVVKYVFADAEGAATGFEDGFDSQALEYTGQEEFEKSKEAIGSVLEEDKSLERKYNIFAKDFIKLAISEGSYDARFRVTVKKFSSALEIEWGTIDKFEQSLVEELVKIKSEEEERDKARQSEQSKRNMKRAFVIGLTAVGGGAILALSAGLAAPLIGAGAVAVLGSGSAAIFTGASGLAVITSIFGAAGAGLTGYKMTKRIGKIEQFEFGSLSNGKHLHMVLAISGFCGNDDDEAGFSTPWEALDHSTEQYFLKWEGKYLRKLGSSIIDFVKREAMQAAVKGILKYTALRAVLKSIAWPLTLISAANIIDNPWNVCTQRSKETGVQLAHVLLSRHQGYRPVTLIGFSLGARAIFYCLQTMLSQQDYQGIIEDVVLIGAPVGIDIEEWEAIESVISGTLYNCYSRSDWLLKFVYRAASVQVGDIAGLGPISVSWPRLVNIDLTDKVNSHSDYADPTVISDILQMIGYKTKAVESKLETTAVKLPHEFVRDISRTSTKILPANFTSASKDKLQQLDLTAEEQETLNRLTSCQNTNVISSWKNKTGIWKGDDSDGNNSETSSPIKPWQKVMDIARRGSSNDMKMLMAPKDVQWKIGTDDYGAGPDSVDDKQPIGQSLGEIESMGERTSVGIKGEGQSTEIRGQQFVGSDTTKLKDVDETNTGKLLSDNKSSEDEVTTTEKKQFDQKLQNIGSSRDQHSSEQTEISQVLPLSNDQNCQGKCLVFINDIESDIEKETENTTLPHLDENTTKKNEDANLPVSTRAERSRSSGDIEADTFRNFPGRGLFDKMRKNVKFALPSPTLRRHRKDNVEKTEQENTKTEPEIETPKESFPKRES